MKIIDIIRYIIDAGLLMSAIYFYIENRKLRGFEIDRDIKIKKAEIKELNNQYKQEKNEVERGIVIGGFDPNDIMSMEEKYYSKFEKIWAEQQYLERLKKYRWIFSKPKRRRRRVRKK